MPTLYLEPIDVCGCGDEGYLTTRTVPVDLIHGVGQVFKVPVYHCRSSLCDEYSLPLEVSRRLDELAEEMEDKQILEADFSWSTEEGENRNQTRDPAPQSPAGAGISDNPNPLVQAFTLQFSHREYEDARVILVVPGEAVFFKSTLDKSEYYLLHFESEARQQGVWFSFSKFYEDDSSPDFTSLLEEGSGEYLKELGVLVLEEVEDALIDEFGEVL